MITVDQIAELESLADDQKMTLDALANMLQIPDDIFQEHLLSGFMLMMYQDKNEVDHDNKKHENTIESFDKLCSSAPLASRECIRLLSIGYGCISMFHWEKSREKSIKSLVLYLTLAATSEGGANALLPPSIGFLAARVHAARTASLSAAGEQGAKSRNKPFESVKGWALEKASGMHGDQKTISRKLAAQLPEHLAGASKDPARLIYDALRASQRLT